MENDRQRWGNFPYLQLESLEVAGVPALARGTKAEQKVATFLRKLA